MVVCWHADKPVIMRTLKQASIGIIVEGIAGIYDGATIDQERVFLEQRKGFIKCAIQAGVGESHGAETSSASSGVPCLLLATASSLHKSAFCLELAAHALICTRAEVSRNDGL